MGGVLRSLWHRPNFVENDPLRIRDDLDLRQPPVLAPVRGRGTTRRPSAYVTSSLGDSGRRHSVLPTRPSYRYQPLIARPRLLDLTNELKMVNWHRLGTQLEVPPDRLDKIEEDHPTSERRLYEVLWYWLNDETDPSWDKICEALCRMGGFTRIVRELKVKYCSLRACEFSYSVNITCAHCDQHHCKFINT